MAVWSEPKEFKSGDMRLLIRADIANIDAVADLFVVEAEGSDNNYVEAYIAELREQLIGKPVSEWEAA